MSRAAAEAARQTAEGSPKGAGAGRRRHQHMRLDPRLALMVDRPDGQVALEVLKGFLDLRKLHIEFPELHRQLLAQIAAQKITALAPACHAQFGAVEFENGRSAR